MDDVSHPRPNPATIVRYTVALTGRIKSGFLFARIFGIPMPSDYHTDFYALALEAKKTRPFSATCYGPRLFSALPLSDKEVVISFNVFSKLDHQRVFLLLIVVIRFNSLYYQDSTITFNNDRLEVKAIEKKWSSSSLPIHKT